MERTIAGATALVMGSIVRPACMAKVSVCMAKKNVVSQIKLNAYNLHISYETTTFGEILRSVGIFSLCIQAEISYIAM